MSTIFRPFIRPWQYAYRWMREQAHEQPVYFWSVILGSMGPVTLAVVPPIRERMGYKQRAEIPTSYPLPNRPRRLVLGYEDT